VELRAPEALATIKAALTSGKGIKAAAVALGVSRRTLYTWGESWPAVGKLMTKHALDLSEVAALGLKARGLEIGK
jgi:transposase